MRTLLLLAAALTVLSACGRRAPLDVPPPPPERDAPDHS